MQGLIWHLLVTHPKLKRAPTKWETVVEELAKASQPPT
jgi:hypothetical protein